MLSEGSLLARMIAIAAERHAEQLDKSGVPYILHCLQVMQYVKQKYPKDYELQCIAVCHDIVEDTSTTFEELAKLGATQRIIDGINAVTKHKGQSYEEYVNKVRSNTDAMIVKMEDLRHNSDVTRLKGVTEKDFARLKRYTELYDKLKWELLPWSKKGEYTPFKD